MFMVASSVVTTIMILNYHHRQADTHKMPEWVAIPELLPAERAGLGVQTLVILHWLIHVVGIGSFS